MSDLYKNPYYPCGPPFENVEITYDEIRSAEFWKKVLLLFIVGRSWWTKEDYRFIKILHENGYPNIAYGLLLNDKTMLKGERMKYLPSTERTQIDSSELFALSEQKKIQGLNDLLT